MRWATSPHSLCRFSNETVVCAKMALALESCIIGITSVVDVGIRHGVSETPHCWYVLGFKA